MSEKASEKASDTVEGKLTTSSAPSSPDTHARNSRKEREGPYAHVSSSSTASQRHSGPPSPFPASRQHHHHSHKDIATSSESPSPERVFGHHHKKRESGRERETFVYDGPHAVRQSRNSVKREQQGPLSSPQQQQQQSSSSSAGVCEWGDEVILLVDRQTFPVNPRLFTRHPDTMLGRMFGSSLDNQLILKSNDRGEYEVARGITAGLFRAVLDYYHYGVINCPSSESVSELRETCDYLMIPFNEKTIKTQNICDFLHELSNEGARAQFERYLQRDILHAMVQCTEKGERECQIVILMEDDVIDWDDQYPPAVGEDHIERVTNTELCRFFKYFENRDIAKDTLREKGLKKIRIGIEGYPTTKEKVRVRAHTGRTEVVYNYVQRPFLRMSWEKDEAKSRHVDFTCVKIKTDIAPDAEGATLLSGNEDNFDY